MTKIHEIEFTVRDYECDMQAVVNNGIYQNYLEHARHEYLLARGINFADVTAQGINMVVIRAVLDYRNSLTSGDHFVVKTSVKKVSPLRFQFSQNIYRRPDQSIVLQASITATSVNQHGRPFLPKFLKDFLENTD
ncbi:MAG: acyl-CoA thioester hydrolase [Planctomycetota bacterium]|jgi:acyl-CoA thioester hydrolase